MRETSAKFNPTRADDEFRLKILEFEITEKQNEEERALQSDFHRRNMLDSGPYIDALIKLSIEQLKERIQLRIEADFEAIHSGDHVEREVESTLKARINNYVGNQGENVIQKIETQMNRFSNSSDIFPGVNHSISQKISGLMQFAQLKISHLVFKQNNQVSLEVQEGNSEDKIAPVFKVDHISDFEMVKSIVNSARDADESKAVEFQDLLRSTIPKKQSLSAHLSKLKDEIEERGEKFAKGAMIWYDNPNFQKKRGRPPST